MATEAAIYNLLIQIGDDWSESFEFRHGIQLRSAASATTTLQVFPLPVGLSSGDTLTFDTDGNGRAIASPVTVTLAANALAGATTIAISSAATIAKNALAEGPVVDLTGSTFEMKIRDKDYNALLATATVTNSAPTTGIITASLSKTITAALTRNCRFEDLPDDIQSVSNFKTDAQKTVYSKSYTWDLDQITSGGTRTRRYQGRVFCTPEATR